MVSRFFIWLIRGYQKNISPYLGSNCRFRPTCSQYTLEAIQIHGAFMGLIYGFYRILRCHPLCKGGYDPVPEKKRKLKSTKCDH